MPQAKKLIEVALPLDAINAASVREKNMMGHGRPSALHLWWSRKPLATSRAVIFATLVEDPEGEHAIPAFVEACQNLPGDGPNVKAKGDSPRMRLFDFIERLVTWEATTDEKIMGQARELIRIATNGNPPPLLDPFAGGGSIPLEAQRLGLEAHASDLNPVAVMINKAMIEIPPRFADIPPVNPRDIGQIGRGAWKGAAGLAADVRYYGEWMRERAFERIGHLYPEHKGETVIAWLWARTVISPNPAVNAPVPLVNSFLLSKKKGRECWARPIINGVKVHFEVTPGKPPESLAGTVNRAGGKCIVSGEPIAFDYIRAEGKAGRIGAQLMAVFAQGKGGRNYYSPTAEQSQVAESAIPEWTPIGDIPEQALGFRVQLYGIDEYQKLFTPRQLVALTTFSDLVHEARELATKDALRSGLTDVDPPLRKGGRGALAYGEAVSVYLALAVDRGADYWSSVVSWQSGADALGHTFTRQTLSMVWNYAEGNPFSKSSGTWRLHVNLVGKTLESLPSKLPGSAILQDAMRLSADRQILSTDPPYYDNIGYADISDFFYIWMRQNLRKVYPAEFDTLLVPKAAELIASTERQGSKEAAKEHFESGMMETFANIRSCVREDFPLTVYYAFKQHDGGFLQGTSKATAASTGWETMLTSLIKAGFCIVGTWPVRTERRNRVRAMGSNTLASSIVLVCRPRLEDAPSTSRRRFLDALRAEIPAAIAEMKTGNIGPVDLPQASIGPGMAIYSRYSQVLEADGSPLTVRAALSEINKALDAALEEPIAGLDAETQFAVQWFGLHGYREGNFGDADNMARGKNTSVESVALAGVAKAEGGKVQLVNWREYDPGAYDPQQDKRPTVWEGTHHLVERLNHHGEVGAAALFNRLPGDIAESVRDLAYRLYHICERKGWAEDALDYNALGSSWSEISRLAASGRESGTQAEMAFDPE